MSLYNHGAVPIGWFPSSRDEDVESEYHQGRAKNAREGLHPSDVLAATQDELLKISDDEHHPLWQLIRHCTVVGTHAETGMRTHWCDGVGDAFMPLIEKAISRLVQERLGVDAED